MALDFLKAAAGNTDLTASEKLVLMCLGDHFNEEKGEAWPTIQTMMGWTGLSENTLFRTLKRLENSGCITRVGINGKGQRYQLHMEAIKTHRKSEGTAKVRYPHRKSEVGTHRKSEVPPPQNCGTEPLGNPVEKPPSEPLDGGGGVRRAHTAPTPTWQPPEWFAPLTKLQGYRRRDDSGTARAVEAACAEAGVQCSEVSNAFAAYYRLHRVKHGWADPVAAFRRNYAKDIAAVLRAQGRAPPSVNGHGPPDVAPPKSKYVLEAEREQRLREQNANNPTRGPTPQPR